MSKEEERKAKKRILKTFKKLEEEHKINNFRGQSLAKRNHASQEVPKPNGTFGIPTFYNFYGLETMLKMLLKSR